MERVSYHWNAVLRERVTPRAFSHLQTETWFFCQLIAIIYLNPSTTLIITTTLFYQHPVFNVLDIMNLAYSSRNRNSRISWLFFSLCWQYKKKCRRRCPFMDAGFVSYFKIVTFYGFTGLGGTTPRAISSRRNFDIASQEWGIFRPVEDLLLVQSKIPAFGSFLFWTCNTKKRIIQLNRLEDWAR